MSTVDSRCKGERPFNLHSSLLPFPLSRSVCGDGAPLANYSRHKGEWRSMVNGAGSRSTNKIMKVAACVVLRSPLCEWRVIDRERERGRERERETGMENESAG